MSHCLLFCADSGNSSNRWRGGGGAWKEGGGGRERERELRDVKLRSSDTFRGRRKSASPKAEWN